MPVALVMICRQVLKMVDHNGSPPSTPLLIYTKRPIQIHTKDKAVELKYSGVCLRVGGTTPPPPPPLSLSLSVGACMYVCMHVWATLGVRMYVCMHACKYVCTLDKKKVDMKPALRYSPYSNCSLATRALVARVSCN